MNESIKIYEAEGFDFLIFRVYDTVWLGENRFRVMISKDSCTTMYALALHYDYSINYITISDIKYYKSTPIKCSDKLSEINHDLMESQEAYKDSIATPFNFRNSDFTLYGKFGEKYLLEYFDQEFVSEFHSGFLYHTVCSYFYHYCER